MKVMNFGSVGHSSSGIPAFMPPERSHEQNVKSLCRGPVVEGIPTFLSGSSDGSVKLWLLSECKLLASLEHVHPRQTVFGAPGKMVRFSSFILLLMHDHSLLFPCKAVRSGELH